MCNIHNSEKNNHLNLFSEEKMKQFDLLLGHSMSNRDNFGRFSDLIFQIFMIFGVQLYTTHL